ncbi:50S ribosomal protein L28 [Buchnera aphidicola (Kurisakia onigurumii)]|uniref:50S ribosomal protein L28 n=1 Tax=Buchnera aphidicola TaxID=9 RepID=UPI0031B70345
MSRICKVTGRRAMFGNNRSHAMNKTKRKFLLNIQVHRFWIPEIKKFIKLKISNKGLRYINKKGIYSFLVENKILKIKKNSKEVL